MIPVTDLPALYRALLLPRLIEEKMLRLLRQNKLSKWFSGIGQEAIAVGVTAALEPADCVHNARRRSRAIIPAAALQRRRIHRRP
jgi:TPP-dependent pyruvate/acetoin dehydrogenase alpha subunit